MNLPSRHRLRNAVCLMTAGIAHALTFAPGPLPASLLPLVQMLSLTILAYATINAANARQAWLRGWLFGLSSFALGLYWLFISMHVYGHLAAPLAVLGVLALSSFLALFGATACALSRKLSTRADAQSKLGACRLALSWAACWAGFEWLRATLFTGFPWLNIGYAHVDSPLSGWAPVLGVHGMAMLAALLAAALACWLQTDRRQALPLLLAILLCLIGLPLSRINWAQASGAPMHVRLVQGNIEQAQKFNGNQTEQNLLQHMNLAALPVTDAPDPTLIVLPETVLPVFQDRLKPEVWEIWQRIAAERKAIIVMGAPLHDIHAGQDRYTNSVIGLTAHTTAEELYAAQGAMRYDKRHLVPWGEYVPPGFRWFVNMLDIPLGNFDRGQERQAPFAIGDQRVAFNICYEDLFGNELLPALQSVDGEPGASILINVSNLGWFGDSWALRQHLQIARLRTIETARPMLTATNTGITAAIEPTGRVAASLPPHQAGILPVTVQGMSGLTPYARFGDKLALALIGLSLIIVITLGRRGRRQK